MDPITITATWTAIKVSAALITALIKGWLFTAAVPAIKVVAGVVTTLVSVHLFQYYSKPAYQVVKEKRVEVLKTWIKARLDEIDQHYRKIEGELKETKQLLLNKVLDKGSEADSTSGREQLIQKVDQLENEYKCVGQTYKVMVLMAKESGLDNLAASDDFDVAFSWTQEMKDRDLCVEQVSGLDATHVGERVPKSHLECGCDILFNNADMLNAEINVIQ